LDGSLLFSSESYAWALQGICQPRRFPFAPPNIVLQQIPPPYGLLAFKWTAHVLEMKINVHANVASP
jgi:hypothetical protein